MGVEYNDSKEIKDNAKKKANNDFNNRSPLSVSFASFIVGFLSLPFWSKKQYETGVEKAVEQIPDGYPNAKGFASSVVAGAILGAIIGTIIVAFASVSWSAGAVIGVGALIGGAVAGELTGGTFAQMAYYRSAGAGKGRFCLNEEREVDREKQQGSSKLMSQEQSLGRQWRDDVQQRGDVVGQILASGSGANRREEAGISRC